MKVYFDSCIVIYLVEKREPFRTRIRGQFHRLTVPHSTVVYTDLTRLECRVMPLALGQTDQLTDFDDYFVQPGLTWHAMSPAVFDLATELRARHRLKTPDALHLAAAIDSGCDEFWTNDRRLLGAAGARLRLLTLDSL
jgi:predicted nucleic acid-binding protein